MPQDGRLTRATLILRAALPFGDHQLRARLVGKVLAHGLLRGGKKRCSCAVVQERDC